MKRKGNDISYMAATQYGLHPPISQTFRGQLLKGFTIIAAVLAVTGLLYAGNVKKLKKRLAQELSAGDYTAAAATIGELGGENTVEAVKVIVSIALAEKIQSQEVFLASKEALSKITEEKAVNYLCSKAAAKRRDWRLKVLVAEVLGNLKGKQVPKTLIALLKDEQPEVLREAIIALSKQEHVEVNELIKIVEALIDVLEELEKGKGLIWVEARKALTTLVGPDYETAGEWKEYWRIRKKELKANPNSPKPGKNNKPKHALPDETRYCPKFFGHEIISNEILFVIDVSDSMVIKDPGDGKQRRGDYDKIPSDRMRIERCKKGLIKSVASLPKRIKFNIITFSSSVKSWQNKKLVPATSKNKQAALNFVKKFKAVGGTFTDDALKEAFANTEADTIFLVSDGSPKRYPESPDKSDERNIKMIDECLNFVRKENRFRKVRIFTFGFDGQDVQRAVDFMKKLARENRGEYKSIK